MDERSGTARLVESQPAGDGRGLVTTLSRSDVEEALRSEEPVDLLLDVERMAQDGEERETARIALGWEPEDLERLLAQASGDEITLTFDEGELQQLLDADVDAHGMRERLAILSVVAGMAAAGASGATGAVYLGGEGGGSTAAPAAVTASEVSTGVGVGAPTPAQTGRTATPAEVSTGITARPTATPAASSPSTDWSPSPEAFALIGGSILALTALGFVARTQRRRPGIA